MEEHARSCGKRKAYFEPACAELDGKREALVMIARAQRQMRLAA